MVTDDHILKAVKSLDVAEQMLIKTYPFVKEPKLMLAIAGEMDSALQNGMDALLILEKKRGNIEFNDCFDSRFKTLESLAKKFGIKADELKLISSLYNIITEHKNSPVEFARKDSFVICDEQYNMDVITVDDMKKYLFRAKCLVEKISLVLSEEK